MLLLFFLNNLGAQSLTPIFKITMSGFIKPIIDEYDKAFSVSKEPIVNISTSQFSLNFSKYCRQI